MHSAVTIAVNIIFHLCTICQARACPVQRRDIFNGLMVHAFEAYKRSHWLVGGKVRGEYFQSRKLMASNVIIWSKKPRRGGHVSGPRTEQMQAGCWVATTNPVEDMVEGCSQLSSHHWQITDNFPAWWNLLFRVLNLETGYRYCNPINVTGVITSGASGHIWNVRTSPPIIFLLMGRQIGFFGI